VITSGRAGELVGKGPARGRRTALSDSDSLVRQKVGRGTTIRGGTARSGGDRDLERVFYYEE